LSPASFASVIAVGGTALVPADNARGWEETAWGAAESGCSAATAKPSWQKDAACPKRMVADIAFDADPGVGVAVYDGNPLDAGVVPAGWRVGGGTSVGAPAIAALFAAAGISATGAAQLYAHASLLNDVIAGSGGTCPVAYFCNALAGYDGPTGNGTPNGFASL
jgi:hypothetical protein